MSSPPSDVEADWVRVTSVDNPPEHAATGVDTLSEQSTPDSPDSKAAPAATAATVATDATATGVVGLKIVFSNPSHNVVDAFAPASVPVIPAAEEIVLLQSTLDDESAASSISHPVAASPLTVQELAVAVSEPLEPKDPRDLAVAAVRKDLRAKTLEMDALKQSTEREIMQLKQRLEVAMTPKPCGGCRPRTATPCVRCAANEGEVKELRALVVNLKLNETEAKEAKDRAIAELAAELAAVKASAMKVQHEVPVPAQLPQATRETEELRCQLEEVRARYKDLEDKCLHYDGQARSAHESLLAKTKEQEDEIKALRHELTTRPGPPIVPVSPSAELLTLQEANRRMLAELDRMTTEFEDCRARLRVAYGTTQTLEERCKNFFDHLSPTVQHVLNVVPLATPRSVRQALEHNRNDPDRAILDLTAVSPPTPVVPQEVLDPFEEKVKQVQTVVPQLKRERIAEILRRHNDDVGDAIEYLITCINEE